MPKCVILANYWAADYKILLFNSLLGRYKDCKVIYIADTEDIREWKIDKENLKFSYEIMFEGSLDRVGVLKCVVKTWKRLSHLNPSVLILGGYSYAACWAGFFWARLNKKKIILWSSSNENDKDRNILKEKIKRYLVRRCTAANTYGQRSRDYLVSLGMPKERIAVTGNTTDNQFYRSSFESLRPDKNRLCSKYDLPLRNFLFVGRFSPEKNIICLLEAFGKLKVHGSDWGLILVGNGPQREEIKKYINEHDIKNVCLPGFKQKQEIVDFYAMSDVFVLPSTYEPWGLVVNEAMASGLSVLVSKRCGCYPDLIKEGVNGFSFDPFDKDELFSHMKDMADNKYDLTEMSKSSCDLINDFTPDNAAKIITKTIKTVCNEED